MTERAGSPGRLVCCTFAFMEAALPAPATGGPVTLYSRRHAKQQRAKALSHLGPAFVLLAGVVPILAGTEPLTLLGAPSCRWANDTHCGGLVAHIQQAMGRER